MADSLENTSPQTDELDEALASLLADYEARNLKSLAQHERACTVLPGGNTRSVLYYPPFPLTMTHGRGSHIWDVDEHEYVNLLGEYTAGLYGHSHPVIGDAIREALETGLSFGALNLVEEQFARAVAERFSFDLVRFTNSGTEANLMAIGLARSFTGKSRILMFRGGYHGAVLTTYEPSSPLNAPYPVIYGTYNDLESTASLIEANADDLAAIIVEPMLGSAGCLPGGSAFLQLLRDKADETGAVLIFDEVMTSRLAPGGLQSIIGIKPDLTTLGKYLGGGSSFGGFGGRADILNQFDARKPGALNHAGTFNNNMLTMSAGLAGLTKVFTPEAASTLNETGDKLRVRLNQVCREHDLAFQFTGIGSLMNAHPVGGDVRQVSDIVSSDMRLKDLLFHHMLKNGFYMAQRGFIALSLAIMDEDIEGFVDAFSDFAETYQELLQTQKMR